MSCVSRMLLLGLLLCVSWAFSLRDSTPPQAGYDCVSNPDSYNCSKTGRCIPTSWLCDGDDDCHDFEDEKNCSHTSCPTGHFMCKSTRMCIQPDWLCDREVDCRDFSDELHPNCSKNSAPMPCRHDQFRCSVSNVCIPGSKVCDRVQDCPHNEDEINCTRTTTVSGLLQKMKNSSDDCPSDHFKCANGRCISLEWFCDDENDCGDGSDEHILLCNATCGADDFHCVTGQPRRCMPSRWRCDTDRDCSDGSDEANCTTYVHTAPCRSHEFTCANGQCITRAFLCDGDYDCSDRSDEGKTCANTTCEKDQFQCVETRFCIDINKICNGEKDCADESDENNCTILKYCTDDQFHCGFGENRCINRTQLCDGVIDCSSGSDESLEVANCSMPDAPKCSPNEKTCGLNKVCVSTKNGHICVCKPGYRKHTLDNACVDLNECATMGLHMCTQTCTNTIGSYICSCHPGYILTTDQRTCIANGQEPKLWVTSKDHIKLVTLSRHSAPVGMDLVRNLSFAVALDYHYRKNMIAYSDIDRKAIFTCEFDTIDDVNKTNKLEVKGSSCAKKLVSDNVSDPNGIAIDWVHDLLYWTDAHLDTIKVVSLNNGQLVRTLIDRDLDEPRAIVVEPNIGLMFWTDWGHDPKIERAAMDGTHRRAIVKADHLTQWPNGLAVDMLNKRLYFVDAKLKHIVSVDYDGGNVKHVLKSWRDLDHPFGLSVFEDRVYWSDWESKGVHYANKDDGSSPTVVAKFLTGSTSIRVYHEHAQPSYPNKCKNSLCPHLCVPSIHIQPTNGESKEYKTNVCLCFDGFRQQDDKCTETVAIIINDRSYTERFIFTFMICIVGILGFIAILVWKKQRKDERRRWTFGNMIYTSRRTPTIDDSRQVADGVMESYDHLRLSFDDDLTGNGDRDAVYRPTTTLTHMTRAPPPYVIDGATAMTSSSTSSLGGGASAAVVNLVRKIVNGKKDSMNVPLTEHMFDENGDALG